MHTMITLAQYLGPYADHPQMKSGVLLGHAAVIIGAMNDLCQIAENVGVDLEDNQATGCAISGSGNGGARPSDDPVGAPHSAHKDLRALDRFDPQRTLMAWLLAHVDVAEKLELYFEHPQWTRHWVHGQNGAPGSGHRFFVPYADLAANPPTCAALPGQEEAGVQVFEFTPPKKAKA